MVLHRALGSALDAVTETPRVCSATEVTVEVNRGFQKAPNGIRSGASSRYGLARTLLRMPHPAAVAAEVGGEDSNPFACSSRPRSSHSLQRWPALKGAGSALLCARTLRMRSRNEDRFSSPESAVSPDLEGSPV